MRFRTDAQLDTSQIDDERGAGGRFSGIPGGGLAIGGGGGIIGLIITVVVLLAGGGGGGGSNSDGQPARDLRAQCRTGADANTRTDCRVVGIVDSVQKFWAGEFDKAGKSYEPAQTRLFTDQIQSGGGGATSDVGPSSCPSDGYVYLDLGFFFERRGRFGAPGCPFARPYVVAL